MQSVSIFACTHRKVYICTYTFYICSARVIMRRATRALQSGKSNIKYTVLLDKINVFLLSQVNDSYTIIKLYKSSNLKIKPTVFYIKLS